ncbi:uracil-DNA glycosylase [Hyphobacterium sp. SN044]|uniref:uracil-DNA glycosylase n=1 Tax=Hyphobacterium sp. SN044 TaxID=2912575 RepID=UPI001F3B030C|nr:uracil-DNA glycosylase [Hyphobacterium sp. SN044]MCF8880804.1 uracil-DNA glycosylase [Hyphobacterium sp. SN044]
MPPAADPRETALKSLTAWWADMGIEPDLPVSAPKPRPRAPEPAARRAPPPAMQAAPATAAAARAAGYGEKAADEAEARKVAAKAKTIADLKTAIEEFEGSPLKRTARNTVFARGNPESGLMIVGEAPGKDEDEQGEPFVGKSGQLLDRMFASIGLDRETDVYVSNILNWRPPGNRSPTTEEIALALPFIERHIALVKPKIVVCVGGVSAQALLRASVGIMRLRGRWAEYSLKDEKFEPGEHIPALPVFHPAYLLRRPQEKKQAWRDLLMLQKRLEETG